MEDEKTILGKMEDIWKKTLYGDENPSQTIKTNYSPNVDTMLDVSAQLSGIKLEEQNTLVEVDAENKTLLEGNTEQGNKTQETLTGCTMSESGEATSEFVGSDDFEVISELGRGGMGIVYLARQKSLSREIALKVIASQKNHSELEKRFISEAVVTADLDHPNIVPIHALNKSQSGQVSIAMKKVGGTSWKQILHPKTDEEQQISKKFSLLDHLEILTF